MSPTTNVAAVADSRSSAHRRSGLLSGYISLCGRQHAPDLVDVAPGVASRQCAHDRMLGHSKMRGRVLVRGIVATTDVPARAALAERDPHSPRGDALLASVRRPRRREGGRCQSFEMIARPRHQIPPSAIPITGSDWSESAASAIGSAFFIRADTNAAGRGARRFAELPTLGEGARAASGVDDAPLSLPSSPGKRSCQFPLSHRNAVAATALDGKQSLVR
jgi:hypothetical protein